MLASAALPGLPIDAHHRHALTARLPSPTAAADLNFLLPAGNLLESTLPAGWGARGAFPALTLLDLSQNSLWGELPASWAYRRSFPNLLKLDL